MKTRNEVILIVLVVVVVLAGALSYLVLVPSSTPSSSSIPPKPAHCDDPTGGATAGNWTTYHQNNVRAGVQTTPSNVTSVHAQWTGPVHLDGQVFAEPLVCGDAVYVATEDDSVYAINATTGGVLWRTHLGTPVPGASLPCGDIKPSGITGTPVIDAATGVLYAVAFLSSFQHVLFGLNVVNGSVVSQVGVDPPGADPTVEQQRGALTLANGDVYVVYGGLDGDCGQYHGWVVGAPVSGTGSPVSYEVPTHREGGIWGVAGTGVASNGNLYVATGNGDSTTTFDHGDSVIELSPLLTELGFFAPTDWAQLNSADTDLGSVAPTVLPNGDVFQIGKAGVGYLLSGTDLGGIGGGIANASVCAGAYGGTAHVGFSVLVPCTDGLYDVVVGPSNLSVAWQATGFDSGSPIVTGNLVWSVNISNETLLGFNLSNGQLLYSFPLGPVDHFISPAAGPDSVYVAGGDNLYAFALN